jgi:hypothetical protein
MSDDFEKLGVILPTQPRPDAETEAAQKQWLKDGTVPDDYIASLRGSTSSVEIPDAGDLVAGNFHLRTG